MEGTSLQIHDLWATASTPSVPGNKVHDQKERARVHEELKRDLNPVGATENFLVGELAHLAIQMDFWSSATGAIHEIAAHAMADLVLPDTPLPSGASPTFAAASCGAVDRAERTRSALSRAFCRTLKLFLNLQNRRQSAGRLTAPSLPEMFSSENACINYLVSCQKRDFACEKCGSRRAHFIPSRACLECVGCSAQTGLRVGTVTADSPLPLMTWFAAILFIIDNPNIPTAELRQRLGLSRSPTVRAPSGQNPRSAYFRRPQRAAGGV